MTLGLLVFSLLSVAVTECPWLGTYKKKGLGYGPVGQYLPSIYRALGCGGSRLQEAPYQKFRRKISMRFINLLALQPWVSYLSSLGHFQNRG